MSGSQGMQWYIVQTYSGYENKAKSALEERIRSAKLHDHFEEVFELFVLLDAERLDHGVEASLTTEPRFAGLLVLDENVIDVLMGSDSDVRRQRPRSGSPDEDFEIFDGLVAESFRGQPNTKSRFWLKKNSRS